MVRNLGRSYTVSSRFRQKARRNDFTMSGTLDREFLGIKVGMWIFLAILFLILGGDLYLF